MTCLVRLISAVISVLTALNVKMMFVNYAHHPLIYRVGVAIFIKVPYFYVNLKVKNLSNVWKNTLVLIAKILTITVKFVIKIWVINLHLV